MILSKIRIVLVEPQYSGNVGSVARAMENCGLQNLYLVKPVAELDRHARAMAANAVKTLNAARIVGSLDEALADCLWAVGFTASSDKRPKDRQDYPALIPEILQTAQEKEVALVFGREDWGLDNDSIDRCRYLCSLPAHPDYASFNLAQAVLLASHALFTASLSSASTARVEAEANCAERETMYADLQETLIQIGFIDNPIAIPHTMRHIRRIVEKMRLQSNEVKILRGVCRQLRWARRQVAEPVEDRPRL